MHILAIGLNHETSDVALRERIAISDVELDDVLSHVQQASSVLESVILSTCNRTEVYAVVSSYKAGEDYFSTLLGRRANKTRAEFLEHVYVHHGEAAVKHLYRVASGLDSMVLGETQILGQVRAAYFTARDAGNTGMLLEQLFRSAITLGKRAQSETEIGQRPVSVSYAAVQLARKVFGNLEGHTALIVGAGKMARLAAEYLSVAGVKQVLVANRTVERAEALARDFNGQAYSLDDVASALAQADVVISSTGAPGMVLSRADVEYAASKRGGRPAVMLDIAVPRDIDASAADVRNIYLYDIDDLKGVIDANIAERARAAQTVEGMIQESVQDFSNWLSEQEVVPLITAIRAKGTKIQADVMASLARKLPELDERELKLIHKHTMSIVNQLLRDPVNHMKELAAAGETRYIQMFAYLFGIEQAEWEEAVANHPLLGQTEPSVEKNVGFIDLVRRWTHSMRLESDDNSSNADALHPVLR